MTRFRVFLVGAICTAGIVGALAGEPRGNAPPSFSIEKKRDGRFRAEKGEIEFLLVRNNRLSSVLSHFVGGRGYRVVWQLPMDCATTKGGRYKGLTVKDILSQVAKEYHLKIKIFSNFVITVSAAGHHYFAVCGRHFRINKENF